jgi:hypothetical protein
VWQLHRHHLAQRQAHQRVVTLNLDEAAVAYYYPPRAGNVATTTIPHGQQVAPQQRIPMEWPDRA